MKFTVTMKDPDTLHDAIVDAVANEVAAIADLDEDEREGVEETRRERITELCNKWFEYGEYLCVEVDTDAGTCVVIPRGN